MLLAIEDLSFANGISSVQPTTPLVGSGNRATPNVQNYSTFSTSNTIVTVAKGGSNIIAGMPVVVYADYSCWVPLIQSFVPPENTNLASKLDQGSGS
jgi:hypothetical protein